MHSDVSLDWIPIGETAFEAECDSPEAVASAVLAARIPGVYDAWGAFGRVIVDVTRSSFDPDSLARLRTVTPILNPKETTVPVVFDGDDFAAACSRFGLSAEIFISMFCAGEYSCLAVGFSPGFPYIGRLPDKLCCLPRLSTPRARVPAGSVAIANDMVCIYPEASSGGWNLIGRTNLKLFDLSVPEFLFETGARVRFEEDK